MSNNRNNEGVPWLQYSISTPFSDSVLSCDVMRFQSFSYFRGQPRPWSLGYDESVGSLSQSPTKSHPFRPSKTKRSALNILFSFQSVQKLAKSKRWKSIGHTQVHRYTDMWSENWSRMRGINTYVYVALTIDFPQSYSLSFSFTGQYTGYC